MATHTAHLLWSCIYSSATNMAAITAATIKYAIDFATAACEQRAINEEQRQLEVLRFEEMKSPSTSECNDSDDVSVGLDESFSKHQLIEKACVAHLEYGLCHSQTCIPVSGQIHNHSDGFEKDLCLHVRRGVRYTPILHITTNFAMFSIVTFFCCSSPSWLWWSRMPSLASFLGLMHKPREMN
mmetsp:Transcript_9143/g.13774  ORF Transcript_9143/g.13774 Transcript_9143/m.13774 type:complete len:183 (-) Transcript_9143:26-574(-)